MCPDSSPVSWTNGDRYEPYIGRWSRLVAERFVPWLGVAPGSHWLEPGCGTGALTSAIDRLASPSSLVASDPSPAYLESARRSATSSAVSFVEGVAEHLDAADASVDAVVSGLMLNFVADPSVALSEARRVTRPGGTVAAYIWDYSGEMWAQRYFWDTAILLDPVARRLHEGRRFASWIPDEVARRLRHAGFVDDEILPIVVETPFRDFDDYWLPMLGQQGSGPTYLATLDPSSVDVLREAVRAQMPIEADGSIRMTARAWAIKATVPEA